MPQEVLTVLVADDQREIRTALSEWLRDARHVPVCAASGREALALLRTMKIDALVTDLVMPDGNGIELTMEARASYPELRIVAISGAEQSAAALAAGADIALRKPLDARQLLHAIAA